MEYQASEEGLEEVEEDIRKGRGGLQSGGNVLQGGDIGSSTFWIGYLGTLEVTESTLERTHMSFMRHITGSRHGGSQTVCG